MLCIHSIDQLCSERVFLPVFACVELRPFAPLEHAHLPRSTCNRPPRSAGGGTTLSHVHSALGSGSDYKAKAVPMTLHRTKFLLKGPKPAESEASCPTAARLDPATSKPEPSEQCGLRHQPSQTSRPFLGKMSGGIARAVPRCRAHGSRSAWTRPGRGAVGVKVPALLEKIIAMKRSPKNYTGLCGARTQHMEHFAMTVFFPAPWVGALAEAFVSRR